MARNKFNRPLLLSVTAAAFTLVAMGGLFLGPSIVECSPDGENIAGNNIASCLIVDLNERLPLVEVLSPKLDEIPDPAPVVLTDIIEPASPIAVAAPNIILSPQISEAEKNDPQEASPPEEFQPETISTIVTLEVSPQQDLSDEILSDETLSEEVVLENSPDVQIAPENGTEETAPEETAPEETAPIVPQGDISLTNEQIALTENITPEVIVLETVAPETVEQKLPETEIVEQKPDPVESEPAEQEIVQLKTVLQAELPAPIRNKSIILPTIDAVEIDGELNFIAGAGEEGLKIRLFVDNELTGTSIVAGGRWLVEAQNIFDASSSRIRADMVDPVSNDLLARAQVSFELEIPEIDIDPVELEASVNVSALPVKESPPLNPQPAISSPVGEPPVDEPPVDEPPANVEPAQMEETAPTIMTINIAPPANITPLPDTGVSSTAALISLPNDNPSEPVSNEIMKPELAPPQTVPSKIMLPEIILPEVIAIATKPVEDDVAEEAGVEFIRPGQTIVEDEVDVPEDLAAIVAASALVQATELAINADNLPAAGIDNPPLPAQPDVEQVMVAQTAGPTNSVADMPILEPAETEPAQTKPVEIQQERSNTPTLRAVIVGEPDELRFASGKVIIRTGDNLWTIASRVYGMGQRYVEIYEANIEKISNPHWIYPGQVFELPKN